MALNVYCKSCDLRFQVNRADAQIQQEGHSYLLRCPLCGQSNQYTLDDLFEALSSSQVLAARRTHP
jgi:transcription elongation factor Elf1